VLAPDYDGFRGAEATEGIGPAQFDAVVFGHSGGKKVASVFGVVDPRIGAVTDERIAPNRGVGGGFDGFAGGSRGGDGVHDKGKGEKDEAG
jgi:hypothetical protein